MKLKDKFEDYLEYLGKKGNTPKTVDEHKRFLYGAMSHSISERRLKSLRLTDVASVIEQGRTHGEYGPQRAVVTFRVFLKYLKDSGHKVPFDWRDVEVPKVPQKPVEYLTKEEIEIIRNSFDLSTLAGLRTRALVEVLIDTGMRISEAISLDKGGIDWEKKEAQIKNAKTKEYGIVYFTDRSLYWLKEYISKRKDDLPCLFVSGRGRLLSVTARNYLRVHTKHLDIEKHIRHHIFRRTLATTLIKNNVDIRSVQSVMRHKSERTTLKCYVGIDSERAKRLHQEVMERQ